MGRKNYLQMVKLMEEFAWENFNPDKVRPVHPAYPVIQEDLDPLERAADIKRQREELAALEDDIGVAWALGASKAQEYLNRNEFMVVRFGTNSDTFNHEFFKYRLREIGIGYATTGPLIYPGVEAFTEGFNAVMETAIPEWSIPKEKGRDELLALKEIVQATWRHNWTHPTYFDLWYAYQNFYGNEIEE